MNRITLAATLTGVLALTAPAAAQTVEAARPLPAIVVQGQADVDHAPDQATVTFTIVSNDDNAGRATSANNATYEALATKLAAAGVPRAQVKTASYDVSYNQRPPKPNPEYTERYGYVVSRTVSVSSQRTDGVGALIDAGIAAGVTSVGSVRFGLRDSRAAFNQALAAAIADADAQARAMASAAHVRIVRILSISAGAPPQPPRPTPMFARASMAATVPTDVPASDLTVHASVAVRYEIAP